MGIERLKDAIFGVHMNTVTIGRVAELLLEYGIDIRELRSGEMILIGNNSWEWGGDCDSRTPARFRIVHNEGGHNFLSAPVFDMFDHSSPTLKVSLYICGNVRCNRQIKEQLTNSLAKQRLAQQRSAHVEA